MIFVDDRKIDFTSFPDGTSSIRIAPKLDFTFFAMGKSAYFIRWMYDNDAECMQLWYLVKHLKSAGNPLLYLEMPYIPNARMDRVKNRDEVFTLKWFAEFINSLGFESVKVLDPHSNVAMALINRAETMYLNRRVSYFKNYADQKPSLNPPFSSVYVCKGMLPKQIIFEEIQKTS